MPKTSTKAEFNNFVKGIISEASPLNFPENASFDEQNFELNRDGTRNRRLGIELESGSVLRTLVNGITVPQTLPSVFKWQDVNGEPFQDFAVVQDGNVLHFFDMNVRSLSGDGFISSVTLGSFPATSTFSLASVDGRLVVACGASTVGLITYDASVFTLEYISLQVRDIWGVVTGTPNDTDISYRGVTTNDLHMYNLQNQSWGIPRKDHNGALVDPVLNYFNELFKYPSNSETVWTGLQFQPVGSGNPFERMFNNLYEDSLGADIVAAKGYYIIDLLNRGPSRIQAMNANGVKYPVLNTQSMVCPADRTVGGAAYVEEFAGRVFYGGFTGDVVEPTSKSPNLSNYVFFTQLIKNKEDYIKCYQAGDPTSRENSDIVDTDGGFVRVSGAERIIGMKVIGASLIILANNGIWALTGGSEFGFTATNYRVDKLSSFGCISPKSIVSDGSKLFYWSDNGIYVITVGDGNALGVVSLTESTIERRYQAIDNFSKESAIGVYDSLSKKIRWVYHTAELFTSGNTTYELILDLVLGSFYLNKIFKSTNDEFAVIQAFDTNKFVIEASLEDVISAGNFVLSDGEQVVCSIEKKSSSNRNVRYLIVKKVGFDYQYSFAYYSNSDFKDWGETDAKAYLLTGDMTAGDSSAKKQVPYLLMLMRATENGLEVDDSLSHPSGCLMRFQWDWVTSITAGKWSNLQQVYRLDRILTNLASQGVLTSSNTVMKTKNKIRGQGRAFSVYFETEPEKDCQILGWNISLNGIPIT